MMVKDRNEGKKNIQLDEDIYLQLKELSKKVGMPMRHYLQEIISEKVKASR